MFKSLSSRSTRSSSQSGSSAYTLNSSSPSTYTPLPPLPPIPPTPERHDRDVPAIRLVAPTPGKSPEGSPILEKRRARTLVPRRALLNKENQPRSENPFSSSSRAAPVPVDPSLHVTNLVAHQFAEHHNRQFYSVGPSTGLSFASEAESSSSAQGSLKAKPSSKHRRILVESRAYPDGGQVEVVKETIGRTSKPILGSVKGTLTRGTIRTVKGDTVRKENDENGGTSLVVKKKKSRGTLDSIRWALGDRTNGARKAEKEKEGRASQDSGAERPRTMKLTIDTQVPRELPLETPITASTSVTSPTSTTSGTITGNTTENESSAAASGGEKTKWRWTIGKKRTKSPGNTLSSAFDRPAHMRANSLDPSALMAATEEPEENAAYTNLSRPSSLNLATLLSNVAESEAEARGSLPRPEHTPIETAPVDFGFEPRTVRKASTGSLESNAGSGTTRKSSIGSILKGSGGENAANTGSFAVRTMRSIRSITSLARLGGWGKGEEDESMKDKEEKKTSTFKERKKRRVKKKAVAEVEEELTTSGESWEAGALGHDPTITARLPIGQPISRENLRLKDERAALGMGSRPGQWAREGRRSSSGSSIAAPSTISSGSYHQSRTSRASSEISSETHTMRSRQDSVPSAPNVPANPGIIFEQPEEAPTSMDSPTTYLGDNAWVGVGVSTLKGRTRRTESIGVELGRRARKPVMGLFDIPPAEEVQPKAVDSPPHLEVRGVKIDKGRVRDRIRAFEAKAEEHVGSSTAYATFSASTGRRPSLAVVPASPTATSLGRAAGSVVDNQRQPDVQEREYNVSSIRCVSAPQPPTFSNSPERPTRTRPWSEQLLRSDEADIDMVNAANSDLSDLINRLDLTFTPDAKQASPDTRRIPAWVEDSPSRRGPRANRAAESSLTSLVGYNQLSLGKPTTRAAQGPADLTDLFTPMGASTLRGHLFPRPSTSKANGSTSTTSSSGSGRTRIESRRRAGMKGTLGEESMLVGEADDGPDSDIPDELQVILAGGSDDEGLLPSPGMPPDVPLPEPVQGIEIPRVVIEDTTETQIAYDSAEEEMERGSRKSFDFTGELGQLKGGSRNSFVEVLVTAFKTPARAGGSGIDDQLELSLDSFDNTPVGAQQVSVPKASEDEIATEEEISFSRAEALAKLTQKSSDRLNQEFRFSAPPADVAANRSQETNDTSSTSGLATTPFALALANLGQFGGDSGTGTVKRRHASIRFEVDTGSKEALNRATSSTASRTSQHIRPESMLGVPSISSHRMINLAQDDPFDYEALMRELDEASSMIEESTQGLERSVSRRRRSKRMSVDSDRSSFYCRTNAPPVSFHNRGYGRHLSVRPEESTDGFTSDSYDRPGLGDKMFQTGVEHGIPLPSIMASPTNSEVSADPQFYYEQQNNRFSYVSDNRRNSYLSERRSSYAPSVADQKRMSFMSYDSLVDGTGDERRYSIDMNSLYERRGRTNSISSISIFGDDRHRRRHNRTGPYPSQYRPVSIISLQSEASSRDDDTMVSMIGGSGEARVPRKSVGSTLLFNGSPCFQAEKRAKQLAEARSDASRMDSMNMSSLSLFQTTREDSQDVFSSDSILDGSPSKGKGRAHAAPRSFARPRPPAAAKMVVEDDSLEEIDQFGTPQMLAPYSLRPLTVSCRKSRPMGHLTMSVARNRSSALICTAEPPDTPPLSIAGSDASSISGGSQSSIDVSRLAGMLGDSSDNAPSSGHRARARGQGHRRRSSQVSRSSMAISFTHEDLDLPSSTSYSYSGYSNSQINNSVMIVDPDAEIAELAEMIEAGVQLSDEQMTSVTRYCGLRNEAIETVERSQKIWQDTDFSRFALSTFTPPTRPSDIQAIISHSQDTYAALPTEFYKRHHARYSRSPRISPYPTDVTRTVKSSRVRPLSVEQALSHLPPGYTPARPTRTVQESPMVSNMGMTLVHSSSPAPTFATSAPLSPLTVNVDPKPTIIENKASKQSLRPGVASAVRRTALGWGRKKNVADAPPSATKTHVIQSSAATIAKENMGVGMLTSPSNNSLRINRPRPKGRTSGSTLRTALRI